MRTRLLFVAAVLTLVACGGVTKIGGGPGGDGGASGSSGGESSSSSGSSTGGSGSGSGGSSSSSGGGSSSSSGSSTGGSSSSSGGGLVGCPATQPMSFSPCSPVGLECEYGDSPSYGCTAHWSCGSGGWLFDDSVSICVTGSCPPNAASVQKGQACTPDGLDCAYPQGECNCSTLGGPAEPEAGGPVWQCFSPGNCPEPRPRIGSPCSQPNQQCDYGACSGGVALQCTNGYWQRTTVPCPV